MSHQMITFFLLLVLSGLLSGCIPRNVPLGPNQPLVGERPDKIEIEVARDGVFKLQNEQLEALPLAQRLPIEPVRRLRSMKKGGRYSTLAIRLLWSYCKAIKFRSKDLASIMKRPRSSYRQMAAH